MVTENLAKFIEKQGIPSSDVIIYHNHKEIFRYHCGFKDADRSIPLKGSELYFLYSATKVITCTAAMRLVEKGIISIDDPVGKYLPAYNNLFYKSGNEIRKCQNTMKIRHLFAMRGGLSYDFGTPPIRKVFENNPDAGTIEVVNAFAETPLLFEPGTNYNYSLCHDVLGAVIEVASGMKFGDFLKKEIFDPLGMADTTFDFENADKSRFATLYNLSQDKYFPAPLRCAYILGKNYQSGGAGLISTVNDYVLFSDALACNGTAYNGYRVLRPETVDLMRSNQNETKYPGGNKPGYGYGFGVRTMLNPAAAQSDAPTDFEFGWDGAAGTYVGIDPYHHLTCVYAQHVLGHGWVYTDVHPVIRDTMYKIAGII